MMQEHSRKVDQDSREAELADCKGDGSGMNTCRSIYSEWSFHLGKEHQEYLQSGQDHTEGQEWHFYSSGFIGL